MGDFHWLSSQVLFWIAFDTNQLQKCQSAPTVGDAKYFNSVIKDVKSNADFELRIRKITGKMCLVGYGDSSLYGTKSGVDTDGYMLKEAINTKFAEIDSDESLRQFDKHKVRSQQGALIVTMAESELQSTEAIRFSPMDCRTKACHRVVTSTFGAETGAAVTTHGMLTYTRAMFAEAFHGHALQSLESYGEQHFKTIQVTDCRSLYDHILTDAKVPEDRHVAIWVASLRSGLGAEKTRMMWTPSRWQLGDGLTKSAAGKDLRLHLTRGTTQLHEPSAQEVKRRRDDAEDE